MNKNLSLHTSHGPLYGHLHLPAEAHSLVLLVRSHLTAADTILTEKISDHGLAVFAMDLLTAQESQFPDASHNVPKLGQRLLEILDFVRREPELQMLAIGLFSLGDASPAALRVAAQRDTQISAVACHGGMIDRAGKQALDLLRAPLVLLCNADDDLARASYERSSPYLAAPHEIKFLPLGCDLAPLTADWFAAHMPLTENINRG